MKPVRYLRIEKRNRGWVLGRFSPAMAAVPDPSGSRPDTRLPDAVPTVRVAASQTGRKGR